MHQCQVGQAPALRSLAAAVSRLQSQDPKKTLNPKPNPLNPEAQDKAFALLREMRKCNAVTPDEVLYNSLLVPGWHAAGPSQPLIGMLFGWLFYPKVQSVAVDFNV